MDQQPRPAFPRLSLDDLVAVTQRFADEVRSGCYDVQDDPAERWHVRIHADDDVDVWLISWTTDQDSELHDHGGSAGAFTVIGGELSESVWQAGAGLAELTRGPEDTVVFGTGYVHDVRNVAEKTAVSVHAYSPPLTVMHYYEIDGAHLHRRARTWTDDPETPSPRRRAS